MRQGVALVCLLLAGCDDLRGSSSDADVQMALRDSERAVEIEKLKGEIEDLKRMDSAIISDLSALQNQVNNNADTANKNGKIDDARWEWVKNHVHAH